MFTLWHRVRILFSHLRLRPLPSVPVLFESACLLGTDPTGGLAHR